MDALRSLSVAGRLIRPACRGAFDVLIAIPVAAVAMVVLFVLILRDHFRRQHDAERMAVRIRRRDHGGGGVHPTQGSP